MEWEEFINKQVFCKSKQGVYSGRFLKYDKPFIVILDMYGNKVLINESEILKLVDETDAQNPKNGVIPSGNTRQESRT